MLTDLIIVSLVGILWGWLWCVPSAHLLDPIKIPLGQWVSRQLLLCETADEPPNRVKFSLLAWFANRLSCPPCMGADGALVALIMLHEGTSWQTVPLWAASIAVHVVYMNHLTARSS